MPDAAMAAALWTSVRRVVSIGGDGSVRSVLMETSECE
jgi:hypothetical protein